MTICSSGWIASFSLSNSSYLSVLVFNFLASNLVCISLVSFHSGVCNFALVITNEWSDLVSAELWVVQFFIHFFLVCYDMANLKSEPLSTAHVTSLIGVCLNRVLVAAIPLVTQNDSSFLSFPFSNTNPCMPITFLHCSSPFTTLELKSPNAKISLFSLVFIFSY